MKKRGRISSAGVKFETNFLAALAICLSCLLRVRKARPEGSRTRLDSRRQVSQETKDTYTNLYVSKWSVRGVFLKMLTCFWSHPLCLQISLEVSSLIFPERCGWTPLSYHLSFGSVDSCAFIYISFQKSSQNGNSITFSNHRKFLTIFSCFDKTECVKIIFRIIKGRKISQYLKKF